MKKKLCRFLLLLTLLFVAACNKKEEAPALTEAPTQTPTSTPSPTPTPVPENPAMVALRDISASLDSFQNYFPKASADYSKGIGYDISVNFNMDPAIVEMMGFGDLTTLRIDGSIDMLDTIATDATFFINDTERLTAQVFSDYENLFVNFPKYSNQYAYYPLEDLLNSMVGEDMEWLEEGASPVTDLLENTSSVPTDTATEYNRVAFGNDNLDFLLSNTKELLSCFEPQDTMETNASIGIDSYVVTGEKYTLLASAEKVQSIITALAYDLRTPTSLRDSLQEISLEDFSNLVLHYYCSKDNSSYAWELAPDHQLDSPVVFVSTADGACLYTVDGTSQTTEVLFFITPKGNGTGILTIPNTEEGGSDFVLEYEWKDSEFSIEFDQDSLEFQLDYTFSDEVMEYEMELSAEGFSMVVDANATQEQCIMEIIFASYGQKMFTLEAKTKLRDYCEIPLPQNYVDGTTWAENLDQEAFLADLEQLMTDYPGLAALFLGDDTTEDYEEEGAYNEDTDSGSAYIPDENYTDDFMNMTGYSIDTDGWVYFDALEEEVLAMGKPSTGYWLAPIAKDTLQKLMDYGASLQPELESTIDSYYNISGMVQDQSVASYYWTEYVYYTEESYNHYYVIMLDAISKDLIGFIAYQPTAEESLVLVNDTLRLMGLETITLDHLRSYETTGEFYTVGDFIIYSYEDDYGCEVYIEVAPQE